MFVESKNEPVPLHCLSYLLPLTTIFLLPEAMCLRTVVQEQQAAPASLQTKYRQFSEFRGKDSMTISFAYILKPEL